MGPCYAMGHAAGLAAVQVVQDDVTFGDVDVDRLRRELTVAGAVVDWHEDD
ncbi:MAG: FAD-dependent oxidoreductase, partial [Gemmatimonadetes bacterium]|nr:FAD-dependent oxidoreductase [Gemmatimonadota bacterium]